MGLWLGSLHYNEFLLMAMEQYSKGLVGCFQFSEFSLGLGYGGTLHSFFILTRVEIFKGHWQVL